MNEYDKWDNDPTKCGLCDTNISHYHYCVLSDDNGVESPQRIPVIRNSYIDIEKLDEFVRWLSKDELDEANKQLNVFFKNKLGESK